MRFGNSVQEYYLDIIRKQKENRKARLRAVVDADSANKYIEEVRQKISELFRFPTVKCPLNTQVTGELKFDSFRMRKVIFESRPGFPVTANLYLPERSGKSPAVCLFCGHSEAGKGYMTYRRAAMALAAGGYTVLVPDPISQGERKQMPGSTLECWDEHNIIGKQLMLTGDSISNWMMWDATRCIDLLLSLPDIDCRHVGVTGNSGGGTATSFIGALDRRITMSAPSCYVTSWLSNTENELQADAEQIPAGAIAAGLDIADFLIAAAPRPQMILGQKDDFFDVRGTKTAYEEIKHIYSHLGKDSDVRLFIGPEKHCFSEHNRNAMYSFFDSITGCGSASAEARVPPELPMESAFCTKSGHVACLPKNRYVREFAFDSIAPHRIVTSDELTGFLCRKLNMPEMIGIPHYRILRHSKSERGTVFSRYGIETEKDRVMAVLKRKGDFYHLTEEESIVLHVAELDSESEMMMPELSSHKCLYSVDVRGIGEMTPSGVDLFHHDFYDIYSYDYHYTSLGLLTGKSYIGGRVSDLISTVELLKSVNCRDITLTSLGNSCITALIAVVIGVNVSRLLLYELPHEWKHAVKDECPVKSLPPSFVIPGILNLTDISGLVGAASKKCEIISVRNQEA